MRASLVAELLVTSSLVTRHLSLVTVFKQLDEFTGGSAERAIAAVDDADGSRPFGPGEGDDGELAAALFVNDTRAGHEAEAEADFDGALDRLDIIKLGDAANRYAVRFQYPVCGAPCRDVALEEHEVLAL